MSADRVLLRAELEWEGRHVVTRTSSLSTERVVLPVVQPPPVDTWVTLRLSFPRLVAPFDVQGRVVEQILPTNPTELPMVVVRLEIDAAARERIVSLLRDGESRASDAKYKILIVEDNSMIRDMFAYGVHKYFARGGGVSVDLAEDGEKAWRMLREETYDLAIVDHYLPVLHGSQLIAKIRSDERISTLPVVAISVGGDEAREAALHAGADLFLDKPVVLKDLFSTLDRLTSLQAVR